MLELVAAQAQMATHSKYSVVVASNEFGPLAPGESLCAQISL